jgi:protease IV
MARWIAFAAAFAVSGCFNGFQVIPCQFSGPIEQTVVYDADCCFCKNKVAIIDVDGVIMNMHTSGLFGSGENPVSLFREKLDAAAADQRVKAVVLRINSPGGAVTASDIMYQDLLAFRHETGKPVVACMMDVAASGGYYLAMAGNCVYAHPTTVTGSIGVIMNLYNTHALLSMVGVKSDPIKSGPNKDLGNPARPMTDEERAILQGMVNSFYNEFVHVVAEGRHLSEEKVRELGDGRVYTGPDAQRLGLVDKVGYLEDALHEAMDLACIKDATIVAYNRGKGYNGSCYAAGPRIPSEINLKLDVPGMPSVGGAAFLYLWEPGVKH